MTTTLVTYTCSKCERTIKALSGSVATCTGSGTKRHPARRMKEAK